MRGATTKPPHGAQVSMPDLSVAADGVFVRSSRLIDTRATSHPAAVLQQAARLPHEPPRRKLAAEAGSTAGAGVSFHPARTSLAVDNASSRAYSRVMRLSPKNAGALRAMMDHEEC